MSRSTTSLNFKIDECVKCEFASTFYPAKILKIDESGGSLSYLIHYQNWNKRYDEWVPSGRLSKIKASCTSAALEKSTTARPKNRFSKQMTVDLKTPKTSTPISTTADENEKSMKIPELRSKIIIESPSPIKKMPTFIKLRQKKESKSVNLPKPNLERIVDDDLVVYKTSNGKRFLTLDEIEQYCKSRKFHFQESDYNFLIQPPPSLSDKKTKIGKKISAVKKSPSPRLEKRKSLTPDEKTPALGKRLRKLNKKYDVEVKETPSKTKNLRAKKLSRPSPTPKKTSPKPKKVEKSPTKTTTPLDVSKKKKKSTKDSPSNKSKKLKLAEKPENFDVKLTKKRGKKKKLEIIPAPLMEQPVECVEVQETGVGQIGSPIDERLPNLNSSMKLMLDKSQQRKKTFSESSTSKLPDMADTQHKGFSLGLYQSATSKLYAQQTQMKSGVYVQMPKPKGFILSPSTSPPIGAAAVAAKRNFQQQPMRYDEHGLPIITDAEIEEGLRSVDAFKFSTSHIGTVRSDASLMVAFPAADSLSGGGGQRSAMSRRGGQRSLSGGWSSGGGDGESSDFNASQRRRVARVSPRGVDNVESMDGDFSIPSESRFSSANQNRRPTSFQQFSSASSSSYLSGSNNFPSGLPSNIAAAAGLTSPPVFHYLPPEVCGDHCYGKNRSSTSNVSEQQRPLTVVTSLTNNKQQATSVRIQLAPASSSATAGGIGSMDGDFAVGEHNRHASTLMSSDVSSPMLSGGMTSPLYQQQQSQAPPLQCRSPLYTPLAANPAAAAPSSSPPASPVANAVVAASSFAAAYEIMSVGVGVQSTTSAISSTTSTSTSAANRNLMPANILEGDEEEEDESDSLMLSTPPTTMMMMTSKVKSDQSPEIMSVIID